jgi:predicted Ser/Thr protein kinase
VLTELPATPDPLFLAFQLAVAGRYSIDREIGRGGMGVVYLAREVHLDRPVAIKLLPPALCARPTLRERFLREARLAAKLSHPNIIPIHAVDEAHGFVFYVMAYVDGETLAQRVHARGPLSASDGIRLLREAAWALGHAHGQGLVHRDVKPDNILIEAASGRALVADFGIAAAAGDTHGDGVCGTPEFMSPEQALGHDVDARSDLYSLGATAFYALSGRLPFEGRTTTETLARQVTEPAPPLATLGLAVPRKLAGIVDRCLAKNPADRPDSAQALAELLGVAIEQRRELPAALRAFVKRNGRLDGGGTLLALNGALLGSIMTSAIGGPTAGVLTLLASAALVPLAFGIIAARRLLDLGFAHADLSPAFQAELESSREERGVQRRRFRSIIERGLRTIAGVSACTSVVLLAVALAGTDTPIFEPVGLLALCGLGVASVTAIAHMALVQLRRDVDVEFWSAAWTGRFGTFAFSVARRWRGAKPVGPAMTHRATELSLGMAAEQLFESLPRASRDTLGDVPALLERLQQGARALRLRYAGLQDALAQAGGAAPDESYAAVRAERDEIGERLRDTVGALETIRLSLLRLHAGSLTLEGLTTHVELAAETSADVQRLIAANREVEDVLQFPREVELTPV